MDRFAITVPPSMLPSQMPPLPSKPPLPARKARAAAAARALSALEAAVGAGLWEQVAERVEELEPGTATAEILRSLAAAELGRDVEAAPGALRVAIGALLGVAADGAIAHELATRWLRRPPARS